ncbi:hypothetical protein DFH28DRAFT_909884, partial [Melampsora americana]
DLKKLQAYYLLPIHEPFEDRSKPKIAYPCRFCHRDDTHPVRVSFTNMTGNLKSHRDGYTQEGRNNKGYSGRLKAKEQEPDLCIPPSVAKTCKAAAKATRPLDSFVVATKDVAFNNATLNQMATLWLIRHAQPWSQLEDPILWGMVHYL